jgi:Mce-associated membrane protein
VSEEDKTPEAETTDAGAEVTVDDAAVAESDSAEVTVDDAAVAESDSTDDPQSTGDESGEATTDVEPAPAGSPRPKRRVRTLVGAIVLVAMLVVSAGLAGWLYVYQYRPDQQTDAAASKVALDAATGGTIALLSYSPESLDEDFTAAKAQLTGDFLAYYTDFTEQIVAPAAKQKSVKTSASVVRAAVSELHPDSAEVLVFINQTTTSKENPDGAFAASSVKVGLKKINGAWLIASFDPV